MMKHYIFCLINAYTNLSLVAGFVFVLFTPFFTEKVLVQERGLMASGLLFFRFSGASTLY